jgi:hypothetical protein
MNQLTIKNISIALNPSLGSEIALTTFVYHYYFDTVYYGEEKKSSCSVHYSRAAKF